jgi:exosortase
VEPLLLVFSKMPRRHLCFVVLCLASTAVFWTPVSAAVRLSLSDYRYSHLVLVPWITAALVWWKRGEVFGGQRWCPGWGATLAGAGFVLYALAHLLAASGNALALSILAFLLVSLAGFLFCYGPRPFKAALFPLLFLLAMVPVPGAVLDRVIAMLQSGSAATAGVLFRIIGEPAYRDGFQFSLPGLTIEVAKECSSIRSGTALLITGLLAGYIYLRSPWRRLVMVAATIPIAIFTNGIRIVSLCWLSRHVNPSFMYGDLHHSGGALFSMISVMILLGLIFLLSRGTVGGVRERHPIEIDRVTAHSKLR